MTTAQTAARQHAMTVLLVDDSLAILSIFGELLSPWYNVRVASSGQRALEVLATGPVPDIILLDVMMPNMDGYAVLKALREKPRHRDIPVLFVTALDENENEEIGLALGAVDFIHKPIKPALLLARMKTYLTFKAERNALVHEIGFLHHEIARQALEIRALRNDGLEALNAMEMALMPHGMDAAQDAPGESAGSHGGDTFPVALETGVAAEPKKKAWTLESYVSSPIPASNGHHKLSFL